MTEPTVTTPPSPANAGVPREECTKCDEIRTEKDLDAAEAHRAFQRSRVAAGGDAEHALNKLFHETVAEVAKAGIERARDSAKYVQTAAAGIGALYTGVLGLIFSVTDHPLPVRGVYAAVFLGLAVALSTAYLAYLTQPEAPAQYAGGITLGDLQSNRTNYLVKWINASVHKRRWAIRASVLCLAFGVAFVAAPLVGTSHPGAIPAAATPPDIPAQIAPQVAATAKTMFEQRVAAFTKASTQRDQAVETAAKASAAAARHDDHLNWVAFYLALGALVVAGTVPMLPWWDG
jgi:hypothetical protein